MRAVHKKNYKLVEILAQHELKIITEEGATALTLAIEEPFVAVVQLLMKEAGLGKGAFITALEQGGMQWVL